MTRRRKLYPHELTSYLNEALAIRHTADYRDADVSQSQTSRLLKWAQAFVGRVQEVIAEAVRQQQIAIQQMEQAAQRQREAERVLQEAARLHLADAPLLR